MNVAGPALEPLLHRLTDCPREFLDVAGKDNPSGVEVVAIVCDLLRTLTPDKPPELEASHLAAIRARTLAELTLISITCWLLSDPWFLGRPQLSPLIWKLLVSQTLTRLAGLVRPDKFINDADRREELVRTCLAQLGLRPASESAAQAADRLATLDSSERDRILRETAAAERRAREIREAMARIQAQESASRYGE
jgi:hypothetical protein